MFKFENLLKYEQTKGYGGTGTSSFWFFRDQSLEYEEEFHLTISCPFHFEKFPFDSHECSIYFGDGRYATDELRISGVTLRYGISFDGPSTRVGDEALILEDLALPFGFKLEVLPIKEMDTGNYNISFAGILMRLERKSLGQLLSGYYYPTTSFALLSMVSFVINPDVVSESFVFEAQILYFLTA